jgi:insulysin
MEIPNENGINVRDELIRFHNKWYSANIMSLAVFGKESLDDLEKMVVSLFSGIENKNIISPKWTDFPFPDDKLRTKVFIVPVKDTRSLTITFQTEDLDKYYQSGVSVISFLLHIR